MFNKLDAGICSVFLQNIQDSFIGTIVQLSDGRRAEVVCLPQGLGIRPLVCAEDGELIDLERNKKISIIGLVYGQESPFAREES